MISGAKEIYCNFCVCRTVLIPHDLFTFSDACSIKFGIIWTRKLWDERNNIRTHFKSTIIVTDSLSPICDKLCEIHSCRFISWIALERQVFFGSIEWLQGHTEILSSDPFERWIPVYDIFDFQRAIIATIITKWRQYLVLFHIHRKIDRYIICALLGREPNVRMQNNVTLESERYTAEILYIECLNIAE